MNARVLLAGVFLGLTVAAGTTCGFGGQAVHDQSIAAGREAFLKGNYPDAERLFRKALMEAETADATPGLKASIMGGLGQTLLTLGRYAESESILNRGLEITEREAVDGRVRAILLLNMAVIYTQTNRDDRAETLLKEALTLGARHFGPESAFVASVFRNVGIAHANTGRIKSAEANMKKALTIAEMHADWRAEDLASTLCSLAGVYALRKEWGKAEEALARAVDVVQHSVGADHPSMSEALSNLGRVYAFQKKFARAETALREAFRIRLKIFDSDDIGAALVSWRLADVLVEQERYTEARELFLKSLPIQERVLGPKSPSLIEALEQFARLLRKTDNVAQAEKVEARARNIRLELMYTVPANRVGR
jgi:tetratricopeptide (TPR) repeat protein